jgi:hypothetical protein
MAGMLGGTGTGNTGGLGDLLGGLLGGSQGGASGVNGILGAMLGGGGSAMESNSFLAPIISGLAEKLGLPPQIAQTVVAFVINKLLSGGLGSGGAPGVAAAGDEPAGQQGLDLEQIMQQFGSSPVAGAVTDSEEPAGPEGLDLGQILQQMGSSRGVDASYLRSTGLHEELAQETGLDPDTAEASLQEVFNMLSGQLGGQPSL